MYYSIDVECVATGSSHYAREVAQISLVNQQEQVLLNIYVKPTKKVISYLTPLTGLNEEILDVHGVQLEQALGTLRAHLPSDSILVGQNIGKDVEWLGLKYGVDFKSMVDLTGLYRIYNPRYNTQSVFSQDHLAKVLLGWNVGTHDAVGDAVKSIRLFNYYHQVKIDLMAWKQVCDKLLASEPTSSFAKLNPSFEGVCMGNRKNCTCGEPFFG